MIPRNVIENCPLTFTPDTSRSWLYRAKDGGEVRYLPVVGWSVVSHDPDPGVKKGRPATSVVPVVLFDGDAVPASELHDHEGDFRQNDGYRWLAPCTEDRWLTEAAHVVHDSEYGEVWDQEYERLMALRDRGGPHPEPEDVEQAVDARLSAAGSPAGQGGTLRGTAAG